MPSRYARVVEMLLERSPEQYGLKGYDTPDVSHVSSLHSWAREAPVPMRVADIVGLAEHDYSSSLKAHATLALGAILYQSQPPTAWTTQCHEIWATLQANHTKLLPHRLLGLATVIPLTDHLSGSARDLVIKLGTGPDAQAARGRFKAINAKVGLMSSVPLLVESYPMAKLLSSLVGVGVTTSGKIDLIRAMVWHPQFKAGPVQNVLLNSTHLFELNLFYQANVPLHHTCSPRPCHIPYLLEAWNDTPRAQTLRATLIAYLKGPRAAIVTINEIWHLKFYQALFATRRTHSSTAEMLSILYSNPTRFPVLPGPVVDLMTSAFPSAIAKPDIAKLLSQAPPDLRAHLVANLSHYSPRAAQTL